MWSARSDSGVLLCLTVSLRVLPMVQAVGATG